MRDAVHDVSSWWFLTINETFRASFKIVLILLIPLQGFEWNSRPTQKLEGRNVYIYEPKNAWKVEAGKDNEEYI